VNEKEKWFRSKRNEKITMIKDYLQSILNTFFKKDDTGVTISKESNNCIVVTINGVLLYKDLVQIQNTAKGMLRSDVKTNCLILAKKFSGWGKDGKWGDLRFMYQSDPFINKIALVADGKWKDELLMFVGDGLRKAAVKFFLSDREKDARLWLSKSAV
jgi:hypothetical protein